ncbi:MAG: energy-coupling factor transporter transmembrane component T [Bifidobacterium adolescentis]
MDADLYVPGDGWLHRADPRVKFLITVVMLVLCLVWRNWAFILDVLIIEHLMLITDGVPLKRIGWVWKILAVIIVFIVVLWPIFDPSARTLWQWGWLKLTRENLVMAAVMGLRIPALGFACFLTLFTTSQTKLIRGSPPWACRTRPDSRRHRAALHSGVLLHLPTVSAAQRARGLDLSGKKDATGKKRNVFVRLVDRFKSYLPIIIAVLIRAYKMSQSVGWAMESRGLNLQGVRRTYRIQLKMRLSDWIILAVTVAATAGSIWLMLWQF